MFALFAMRQYFSSSRVHSFNIINFFSVHRISVRLLSPLSFFDLNEKHPSTVFLALPLFLLTILDLFSLYFLSLTSIPRFLDTTVLAIVIKLFVSVKLICSDMFQNFVLIIHFCFLIALINLSNVPNNAANVIN